MTSKPALYRARAWWEAHRAFSLAELIADGVVHTIGLVIAIAAGSVLLSFAALQTAPANVPALLVYISSLITVLGVSLAFNLWPASPMKRLLARLDQAAIFLFIAASYTPFLALIGDTSAGQWMTVLVWGAALIGIALKLIVPQRFGRLGLLLYLGIGWSGVLVFQALAKMLPETTLWFLLAGGLTYSAGIVFHLWKRLKFQNVLWHVCVVAGASLHLWAILDCMVLSRL